MLGVISMYRIKATVLFRQLYLPGMRGALAFFLVNLIVILTIKIMTRRLAHAAMEQHRLIAKPVHRRLAHALVATSK